jgi:hypothetical protein
MNWVSPGGDAAGAKNGGDSGGAARRRGGLLTPGLAVGGLTSLLLCMLWQQLLPGGDWQFCSRRRGGVSRCIHADAANGGGAGDGVHPHGSQLSGPTLLCAAGAFLTCRILDKTIPSETQRK